MSNINKMYALIEKGFFAEIVTLLGSARYSLQAELQYVIMNLGFSHRSASPKRIYDIVANFPSVDAVEFGEKVFVLHTQFGTIKVVPLHLTKEKRIATFVKKYDCYSLCHEATNKFLRENPEFCGETSLVANQFGERHYHSCVSTDDGYVDFSNNVLWSVRGFETVMFPERLNRTTGTELDSELSELTTDDLPDTYTPLLRLAVSKQLKKERAS